MLHVKVLAGIQSALIRASIRMDAIICNALRIDNCDDNRKISYKQNETKQVNGIFVIVVDPVAIEEYERGILMVNKTME